LITTFQAVALVGSVFPAAQLLFQATTGGQLGHGFLAEITALVQFDPIRQTQFEGIGVTREFLLSQGPAMAVAPTIQF